MLCKYNNILGEPRKGIHSYRIFDLAIVDIVLTIVCAIFLSYKYDIPIWINIIGLHLLGVVAHRLFCVNTKINSIIFG